MIALDLSALFTHFCEYLDGKLKWSGEPKLLSTWTKTVFPFFDSEIKKQGLLSEHLYSKQHYALLDYVWIYDRETYPQTRFLHLAVEHENKRDMNEFLDKEINHLIDIKTCYKVAIGYPRHREETELLEKIRKKIESFHLHSPLTISNEEYLIIFGFSDTLNGKPAIMFKGYIIDQTGKLVTIEPLEKTVYQKRTKKLKSM